MLIGKTRVEVDIAMCQRNAAVGLAVQLAEDTLNGREQIGAEGGEYVVLNSSELMMNDLYVD